MEQALTSSADRMKMKQKKKKKPKLKKSAYLTDRKHEEDENYNSR